MDIFWWFLVLIFVLVGISGVVLPAIPGIPVAFLGFLIGAWIDDFQKVGLLSVAMLAVLTILSILLDFIVTGLGAKKVGASWCAAIGAVIGTVAGIFFGIVGLILGPFVGAVIGEFLSKRDLLQAGKVGVGTWIGMVVGVAVKLAIIFTMVGVFILAYFFG